MTRLSNAVEPNAHGHSAIVYQGNRLSLVNLENVPCGTLGCK